MHPTHSAIGIDRLAYPGRPGILVRICEQCGEFLPHACAPVITVARQNWTGRRIITITSSAHVNGGEAA